MTEKWEEILPHNLKPMDENSPIIDLVKPEETQTIDEPQPINEPVTEFVPTLGDDEVREMVEEPEENPDVPKINRLTYTNRNE